MNEKVIEYSKKGYSITKEICPKCKNLLLREPNGLYLICVNCGYREKDINLLNSIYKKILDKLNESNNLRDIYFGLKSLYLLEKIKKNEI